MIRRGEIRWRQNKKSAETVILLLIGEVFGKDGDNWGGNNDGVGNRIGIRYKHHRQQLTLWPNLFEINSWWGNRQEGIESWITWITWSIGQGVDKSWRQKRKIYFKWKEEISSWSRGIRGAIQLSIHW